MLPGQNVMNGYGYPNQNSGGYPSYGYGYSNVMQMVPDYGSGTTNTNVSDNGSYVNQVHVNIPVQPQKNTRLAPEVVKILNTQFKVSPKLTKTLCASLAKQTSLTEKEVIAWFKQARKKIKKEPKLKYRERAKACLNSTGGIKSDKLAEFKRIVTDSVSSARRVFVLKILKQSDDGVIRDFTVKYDGLVVLNGWISPSLSTPGELPEFIKLTLEVLAKFPISVDLLKRSGIGKTVAKYSKITIDTGIARTAGLLVKKWKADVNKKRTFGEDNSRPAPRKKRRIETPGKSDKDNRSQALRLLDESIESIEKGADKKKKMREKREKYLAQIGMRKEIVQAPEEEKVTEPVPSTSQVEEIRQGAKIRWVDQNEEELVVFTRYQRFNSKSTNQKKKETVPRVEVNYLQEKVNHEKQSWEKNLRSQKRVLNTWTTPKRLNSQYSRGSDSTLKDELEEETIEIVQAGDNTENIPDVSPELYQVHYKDSNVPTFPFDQPVETPNLNLNMLQQLLTQLSNSVSQSNQQTLQPANNTHTPRY
eukprot:TRINITY_DN1319_c0_g1_i3.p1 TRINITY_DN1319_c0_g1~~TRINITY_DN1319_c0_g1_i3.p1  ORF type:complete len:533 (+),score=98.20 TRINITY_DN1319_c0_g1_i3:543-2141(+)